MANHPSSASPFDEMEYDTYLQVAFHGGRLRVRLSGRIKWSAERLRGLCGRVDRGQFTGD
ncbi:hypothetical protein NA56DRAFT_651793, partial [Hyaloscypha hepaticicola]